MVIHAPLIALPLRRCQAARVAMHEYTHGLFTVSALSTNDRYSNDSYVAILRVRQLRCGDRVIVRPGASESLSPAPPPFLSPFFLLESALTRPSLT